MNSGAFTRQLQLLALIAAWGVGVSGGLVLLGWTFDITVLKSVADGWPKMPPIVAVCFLLSGISLWCRMASNHSLKQQVSQMSAAVVASIGLLQVINLTFAWNLNFHLLGFDESLAADESPAQMAMATALIFLLLGGALLFAQTSRRFVFFQTFVLLGGSVSWLGALRFLYGGEPLLPLGQLSIFTAACSVLLTIGIFCSRTDGGLMALFVMDSPGGLLVRRLLPPAVIIPFLVGWLRWRLQVAGWYGTEAGIALFGLSNVILFIALIWRNAKLLHRADVKIRQAHESQVRLAAIVDSSGDAIISKTLEGIITTWNPGAVKMFGFPESEAIGQPLRLIFPQHLAHEETEILARIARGESVPHFETVRVHKDGKLIDVSVTVSPIFDSQGTVVGASTITRNITQRKLSELALQQSELEQRQLAEQLAKEKARLDEAQAVGRIGSWEIDLATGAVLRSAEIDRIFETDLSTASSTFHAFLKKVHPADRTMMTEAFERVRVACSTGALDHRLLLPEGRIKWVEERWQVFSDTKDQASRAVGTCRDISEHKMAEEEIRHLNTELERRVIERTAELEAANEELESFSYSVSHDLRAPLRAVSGFAGILHEDYGPLLPAEGKRYLQRIQNGGKRMGELIDDLLALSRLGRQALTRRPVDTARLVQAVLQELQAQHTGRAVEFRIGELAPCHGDPALLKQVWTNLLSNAIKYTRGREPAVIDIRCEVEQGETIWLVRDNGTGFDMQYAHKLFGVFQRLHRADQFEGTGVGLAIVQRIVHRHRGRVWAQAQEHLGATFYFTLEPNLQP